MRSIIKLVKLNFLFSCICTSEEAAEAELDGGVAAKILPFFEGFALGWGLLVRAPKRKGPQSWMGTTFQSLSLAMILAAISLYFHKSPVTLDIFTPLR